MTEHEKINYVEFPAKDIEATKAWSGRIWIAKENDSEQSTTEGSTSG